jgi:hypothetical protein
LKCNFSENKAASSSHQRAQTFECKELIENAACYFKTIDATFDYSKRFKHLQSQCPLIKKNKNQLIGCLSFDDIKMERNNQILNKEKTIFFLRDHNQIYDKRVCVDYCLTNFDAQFAAFREKPIEAGHFQNNTCICFIKMSLPIESYKCNYDSNNDYNLYTTGHLSKFKGSCSSIFNPFFQFSFKKGPFSDRFRIQNNNNNNKTVEIVKHLPKIVFFLSVNERSYEYQIKRLIKRIYNQHNYYYIHIDQVIIDYL